MHLYAEGGHGFVAEELGLPCDSWFDRYLDWMRHHARPLSDDRPQW
jgi:hypothetical protein